MIRASVLSILVVAAAASPVAAQVIGACHISPVVSDIDRSLRFYRDLLGLEVTAAPPVAWDDNRALRELHGLPDVRMRYFSARVPGARCGIEPVEFDTRDRSARPWRMHDPGAVTLILLVRDIDSAFAKLKAANVPVVTTGGAPVFPSQKSKSRAVIVRDPDGQFVELAQLVPAPATTAPETSNVFDMRFRVTVTDVDKMIRYYQEQLGIAIKPGTFTKDPGVMAMMGLPATAEYAVTMTPIPGSTLVHEFLEVKGLDRTAAPPRIQDPGAYRLQLTVKDLGETLAALARGGSRPLARGGSPTRMTIGQSTAMLAAVPDPSGIVLVLRQAPLP
jgi:catechol 2,3-dioxygenase-like lactoylglutathione lyase family enzyme